MAGLSQQAETTKQRDLKPGKEQGSYDILLIRSLLEVKSALSIQICSFQACLFQLWSFGHFDHHNLFAAAVNLSITLIMKLCCNLLVRAAGCRHLGGLSAPQNACIRQSSPIRQHHLIKKAVAVRKHLERNRKDKDSKFRLILKERLTQVWHTALTRTTGFLKMLQLRVFLRSLWMIGKPAIHPAQVDLKGKPYELLMHNATRWLMDIEIMLPFKLKICGKQ
eukprot:Gb_23428 [translate_table: standard]